CDIRPILGRVVTWNIYQWKPPDICSDCEVFGHYVGKCDKRPRTEEEIEMVKKKKEQTKESMTDRDGFRDVMRKNRNVQSNTFNNSFNKYQRKPSVVQNTTVTNKILGRHYGGTHD
ncbi:hypothetical protein Tco_1454428, partial [Tanacetum coccineum]